VVIWYPLCAFVSRRESRESLSFGVWSGAGSVRRKADIFASLSVALKKSLRIRPLTQGEDRLTVGLRHRPVRVAWCARLGAGLGFLYPPFLGVQVWLSGRSGPVGVAACLTLMPVARAIKGDGCVAMFMAVSAVAAAWGAACTSVGDRSMRNYSKFSAAGIHCPLRRTLGHRDSEGRG
jgi:hypothetical protein